MQEKKIELNFISAHFSELDTQEQELINNAKSVFQTAYAPYSGFIVGASILLENGKIINGSNQENVAYPSGLCAERVAMFYVGARYPDIKIKIIWLSKLYARKRMDLSRYYCEYEISWKKGEKGLVQLISILPTSYPGHNIITEDIGEIAKDDSACTCIHYGKRFKIHGRIKNAEIRGCSDIWEKARK